MLILQSGYADGLIKQDFHKTELFLWDHIKHSAVVWQLGNKNKLGVN